MELQATATFKFAGIGLISWYDIGDFDIGDFERNRNMDHSSLAMRPEA